VEEKAIDAMWTANSNMSKTFGTAVHLAMEQWFKHNGHGTKYHLPKHPFLLKLVKDFPLKDADVYPEIMVSCVERKMVGQIDGLVKTGENPEDKRGYLIDYKTDAEVEKNLPKHFAQLSFYAFILKQFGWEIEKVEVWNYTTKWENHASDVLNLKELQNGKASNN
jgi:ATP-dependent exoDNAse (exonuclease V) beta subunit